MLKRQSVLACAAVLWVSIIGWAPVVGQRSDQDGDLIDLIHYGDVIDVDVVGNFDFDWRGSLDPEGYLAGMDKVSDPIFALCRSESELATAISAEYSHILRDPKVVVKIIDRTNRAAVIMDGAVKRPQRFQIRRPVDLQELIVRAGGITDRASGDISIFRPRSLSCLPGHREISASEVIKIRITDLLAGKEGADPHIISGDIISVDEAEPIYLIGGVNNPGQISSRSTVTLTRAIATAGGLSKDAMPDKITIFHRRGGIVEVDLTKIEGKQADDPELKPFDIVDIAQKGRTKRRFPQTVEAPVNSDRSAKLPLQVIE